MHCGLVRWSCRWIAVLRKVARMAPEAWDALPVPRLPKKLRAAVQRAYGKETVAAIEVAHLAGAPLDGAFPVRDRIPLTGVAGRVL